MLRTSTENLLLNDIAPASTAIIPSWRALHADDAHLQVAARLRIALRDIGNVVAVTGIGEQDGATSLAACLGIALASLDRAPVLVVDGNVRSPGIHEIFDIAASPGLLDALEGRSDLKLAGRSVGLGNLTVLPLGESEKPMGALLTSPTGLNFMKNLANEFKYVLVDAGLIQFDAAGMLLASSCNAVVLATGIGLRRQEELTGFTEGLGRLGMPLLGVVLTRGKRK